MRSAGQAKGKTVSRLTRNEIRREHEKKSERRGMMALLPIERHVTAGQHERTQKQVQVPYQYLRQSWALHWHGYPSTSARQVPVTRAWYFKKRTRTSRRHDPQQAGMAGNGRPVKTPRHARRTGYSSTASSSKYTAHIGSTNRMDELPR